MQRALAFGLLAVAWLLSAAAVAEEQAAPAAEGEVSAERPPEFAEVLVVTASRTEEHLADAPAAVTVIGAEAVAASPAGEVGDLLRSVPGVNVVQLSARDVNVTSRAATGVVANTQLVLVDGRPINSSFFGNVPWDLAAVSRPEIAQIEVIRGPASAVWGSGAMSGVVNVITRLPREMQETTVNLGAGFFEEPAGDSRGGGGSLFFADFSHGGSSSDHLAYQLSLGAYQHDAFARPTGFLPNPSRTPYPPYGNEDTAQPRARARLDLSPADGRRRVLVAAGYSGTEGIQMTPGGPFLLESDNSLSYVQADYAHGTFQSRFYLNWYDAVSSSLLSRGADGAPIRSTFETRRYAVELSDLRRPGKRHLLTYGLNASYDAFELALAPEGEDRDEQGAYLQDDIAMGDSAKASVGVRVDRFSVLDEPVVSPRLALLFTPAPSQTVRLSYNRAYRAPSLFENFIDFDIVSGLDLGLFDPRLAGQVFTFTTNNHGSLDLEEVSQDSYELGYTGALGRAVVTAAYYYTESDDVIKPQVIPFTGANPPPGWPLPPFLLDVLVGAGSPLPAVLQQTNVGRVRDQGVEVGFDLRTGAGLRLYANYSWQDRPDPVDIDPSQLNRPPEHRVNAGAAWRRGPFEGNLRASHVDDAFWADVLDARFHGPTEAFTLVGAGVGWWWKSGLATSLQVSNLLDERVQQHVFGDLVSRQVVAELRLRF